MDTMKLMNRNYLERRCDTKGVHVSNLAEVEKMLIDAYMKTPRSKEEQERFEANLCGNSNMFGDKAYVYQDLETVYSYFNQAKENKMSYDYENVQKAA